MAADIPRVVPADASTRKRGRRMNRLLVDARRLAVLLCSSLRWVRTLDAAGKLPTPVRVGGRVLWRSDEIRDWLAAGCPDRETWELRKSARSK